MVPFSSYERSAPGSNKITKSQEKFNLVMHMDDIKLFAKNEKELETDSNNKNIQPDKGMEFGIEKYAILIMKSGKRHNGRNRTVK